MDWLSRTSLLLPLAAFALSCGGPSGPTAARDGAPDAGSPSGGTSPGGSGTGGSGGGGAPSGSAPAPAHVTLTFDRTNARDDGLDHASLDVVRVLVFTGATPPRPADRAACADPAAVARDVSFQLALDLHAVGRVDLGKLDAGPGTVGEVRLVLSGADFDDRGRGRHGVGRLTCVEDDGSVRIVVRLLPAEHIELEADRDEQLVAAFDDRAHVVEQACALPDDHGGHGDDGCEDVPGADGLRTADHGGGDDQGGDDNGGGSGGGDGGGKGSRVLVADELPLRRTR